MSLDDGDQLAYSWTKVKLVQKYMSANNCSLDVAEQELCSWIDGLMDSRIELSNHMLNASNS